MSGSHAHPKTSHRPGWIALLVLYLVFAALLVRTLSIHGNPPSLPRLLAGELIFIVFFTAVFLAPKLPDWLMHLYFVLQATLIWWLISALPEFDFLILLYLLACCQAALAFTGWEGWLWAGIYMLLSAGSLMYFLGIARGLSLALTTMAAEIVVAAYVRINREILAARLKSQTLLSELSEKHHQLEGYASQVEQLAALQERNRLSRELHDSVSQVLFSITLTARSAQLLQVVDMHKLKEQIERIRLLSTDVLGQLRSLITELRPPQDP